MNLLDLGKGLLLAVLCLSFAVGLWVIIEEEGTPRPEVEVPGVPEGEEAGVS